MTFSFYSCCLFWILKFNNMYLFGLTFLFYYLKLSVGNGFQVVLSTVIFFFNLSELVIVCFSWIYQNACRSKISSIWVRTLAIPKAYWEPSQTCNIYLYFWRLMRVLLVQWHLWISDHYAAHSFPSASMTTTNDLILSEITK